MTSGPRQRESRPAADATPTAGPRIVFGGVSAGGEIRSGSDDFTVTKTGGGLYSVVPRRPFAAPPSVTATIWGQDWWMADTAHIGAVAADRFLVLTSDSDGNWADRDFCFQAIGPAAPGTPGGSGSEDA
ncbi:hypothetical protein ACFZAV_42905 [Streptomyces sp. NPDC008343]|uniref:hypothetical protein n=1 Tax=Streptomyces sp. NPDC008343 TaxID=3364828 RepID=UPI0036E29D97